MKKHIFIVSTFLIGLLLGGLGGYKYSDITMKGMSMGYLFRGHDNFENEDYIAAIANFNRAIAMNPNSFLAHLSLADTYFILNNVELALEEYEITLDLSTKGKNEEEYIRNRIDILNEMSE